MSVSVMLCYNQSAAPPFELNNKFERKMTATVKKRGEHLCFSTFNEASLNLEPTFDFTAKASVVQAARLPGWSNLL